MLEYDRDDLSEGIGVNKNNGSCECIIWNYWFFLEINSRFQPKVCDGCHELMQKTMSFNDVAIVFVKGNYYRIHFFIWVKIKQEIYLSHITVG